MFIKGRKLNISVIILHSLTLLYQNILDSILHAVPTPFNHWSDIDFEHFMKKLIKKFIKKLYQKIIVNHAILASDDTLRFRKNLLGRILKLIITIYNKINNKIIKK